MIKPIFNFIQYILGVRLWDFIPGINLRRIFYKHAFTHVGLETKFGCHLDFACPHGSKMRNIVIGDRVLIGRDSIIEICTDLNIENDVWISEKVTIFRHNHVIEEHIGKNGCAIEWSETLVIRENTWIGHGVIILPKVQYIGKGSVIAAGAIVTKDVKDYTVVAGNPAKIIKQL